MSPVDRVGVYFQGFTSPQLSCTRANWFELFMLAMGCTVMGLKGPTQGPSLTVCLHGGGGPQIGEVTRGRSPHLSCKRGQIKMRDYIDRRVTSPTWSPPPPCRQALRVPQSHDRCTLGLVIHWKKTLRSYRVNSRKGWVMGITVSPPKSKTIVVAFPVS